MSETVNPAQLSNSNLFTDWLSVTNQLASLMATDIVTANSVANGSQTSGNGFVTGQFGATTLVGNAISGGWVGNKTNLNLTSNLVSGNVSVNTTSVSLGSAWTYSINVATSGTSAQLIDTWSFSAARASEYVFAITNNPANGYSSSKVLILTEGVTAYITEWAQLNTNGVLGVFSANIATGNVNLWYTPVPLTAQVKGFRIQVAV